MEVTFHSLSEFSVTHEFYDDMCELVDYKTTHGAVESRMSQESVWRAKALAVAGE